MDITGIHLEISDGWWEGRINLESQFIQHLDKAKGCFTSPEVKSSASYIQRKEFESLTLKFILKNRVN